MKIAKLFYLLTICTTLQANDSFAQTSPASQGSFTRGNQVYLEQLEGSMTVKCVDGRMHSVSPPVHCHTEHIYGGNQDYFSGPTNPMGSSVEIEVQQENGIFESTLVDYDGIRGKSLDTIDLLQSSFFNNPILGLGKNELNFKVYDEDGNRLESGHFQVQVSTRKRNCPSTVLKSNNIRDCQLPQLICHNYFKSQNYCH